LFADKVKGADEGKAAFKGLLCALWERIGKRGVKGLKLGRTGA